MKLTKRLQAIANLIDDNVNVVDIGCDHALLDIYLTIYKNNKCIASDINKNALQSARNNIKKYQLEDKIKIVLSDGLNKIKIPDNSTIVISGMGTNTILNILKNSDINKINTLIIQSNNDLYLLRKEITNIDFYIENETVIQDKKIFYNIIKFKKGRKKYNYFQYLYGMNLNNKDYLQFLIDKNNNIIKKLPYKKIFKRFKLKINNVYLKQFIKRK